MAQLRPLTALSRQRARSFPYSLTPSFPSVRKRPAALVLHVPRRVTASQDVTAALLGERPGRLTAEAVRDLRGGAL